MALIVQKYGGTSVGNPERIKNVAKRIIAARQRGDDVVAAVSAMGNATDHLIELSQQVTDKPDPREMDVLLSTGELVSSALLTMALQAMGQPAISLSGQQAGIRTETRHRQARITGIDPARIQRELAAGRVVIVAGFQGVTEDLDVTTLGRGASDITAVALAAQLNAARCERFTDVEGVFTADPRMVPEARKLKDISYDEMLELASYGAVVMQPRAVELGSVYNVPIFVASSFTSAPGTLIHGGTLMESPDRLRGLAHENGVNKITVQGVPDRPGVAAALLGPLSDAGVRVDTIVQNVSDEGVTDITFTVGKNELAEATRRIESAVREVGAKGWTASQGLAKVSLVGAAMRTRPGFAAQAFKALFEAGVNIEMLTTSDLRITCLIAQERVPDALRALHKAFHLELLAIEG